MYVDVYTYNTVVWCTFPEVLFAVIDVDALLVLMIFGMESGIVRFGIANIFLLIYTNLCYLFLVNVDNSKHIFYTFLILSVGTLLS